MKGVQIFKLHWCLTILSWIACAFPLRTYSLALSRRSALKNSGTAALVALVTGGEGWVTPSPSGATENVSFQSYRIIPDASASLNPTLQTVKVRVDSIDKSAWQETLLQNHDVTTHTWRAHRHSALL